MRLHTLPGAAERRGALEAALAAALGEAPSARPLLADGATGTQLDALLGDEAADRRELVPLERPEVTKAVHEAYLKAGADVIKTATFNANARSLARLAARFDGKGNTAGDDGTDGADGLEGAAGLARRLNAAAASIARAAADEAFRADGRIRWVAGSIGPGADAPSLGGASYGELKASYLPQCLGLIEGGADLALIETIQDTLQCKAAVAALSEAGRGLGRRLPFVASATVDARGRLLSGADAAAFAAIVEPLGPLALGLNCSGGPEELGRAFAELARAASVPLSIMPNAGLPRSSGGRATWPLGPEAFAERTAALARGAGAAIAGGCCGSGPEHIAALARALALAGGPAPARPSSGRRRAFALASAFSARRPESGPLIIDERANASGSAAFKALVKAGDEEAAARFVLARARGLPGAVDLSVAGARALPEPALLAGIVGRVAPVAEAALSIATTDEEAVAAALPLVGGRPLINSVNLEDEAKAARILDLAREHGAAVVCLAMDASGPARDAAGKLAICRRLYDLVLSRGLEPTDLLFDACTFPVAAGDKALALSAVETLAALRALPEACPGSGSVLGVGNVSFGLPKALRPALTSRFLAAASAAGLTAAIVDPAIAAIEPEPELARAADALIRASGGVDGYGAALERLLALAPAEAAGPIADLAPPAAASEPVTVRERLKAAVSAGDETIAASLAPALALEGGREGAAAAIAEAMTEVGRRYDAGALALPLVLRNADAARAAFGALKAVASADAEQGEPARGDAPRVVLSTVKGDLHDIGKNLVGMVLEAAGYEVVDLGIDRSPGDIAEAATGALAVGVSGLLTRSLAEMEGVAKALAAAGSRAILLCGGAAVDPDYVARRIAPERPGLVAYAKDPFEAVSLLASLPAGSPARAGQGSSAAPARQAAVAVQATAGRQAREARQPAGRARVAGPAFVPPFLGSARLADASLDELLGALDERTVYRARWGYEGEEDGKAALAEAVARLRADDAIGRAGGLRAACRYGFFKAAKEGDAVVLSDSSGRRARLAFPRQAGGERLSIADYYADDDAAAAFCVTLGRDAADYLRRARGSGDSSAYLRAHGLLAGLAEAAAALAHERLAAELRGRGAPASGRRYSFGYPACPGVEHNGPLLGLLGAEDIGLSVTEGHQLDPEFSVTALLVPRAEAKYFSLGEERQGE